MNIDDEAILRALRRANDPDREPDRHDELSDESEEDIPKLPQQRVDPDMERLQNDAALRQHLGIGSAFTGPKGVKEDYKFHLKQERARRMEKQQAEYAKMSARALSSGWMQRTIAAEEDKLEDELEDDDFFNSYRQKRLQELQIAGKVFGCVQELDASSFAGSIEKEAFDVTILVQFYDHRSQESRLLTEYWPRLAKKYKNVKFCRILARAADPNYDLVALPAVYAYKNSQLLNVFLRLQDEIPDWADTGRITLKDLEQYFRLQGILGQATDAGEESEEDESDYE